MLATKSPFPQYFDLAGDPLDAGYVYFGLPNQNPETAPAPIFWDAAGLIPAAQPIRTTAGYTMRAGTAALIFTAGDYSITVRNRNRELVYAARSSAEFANDAALRAASDAILPALASTTDAAKGAALAGFGPTLSYPAGTLGALAQDGRVNVAAWLTADERAQVKANGTTADLAARVNAAKTWAVHRLLHLLAGTWSLPSVDLRGTYGGLAGDGMVSTTVRVRTVTAGAAINVAESLDVVVSPLRLADLTLDCDGKAAVGVDVALRHHYELKDLLITGATSVGLREKDTWLGRTRNVRITNCPIGRRMVGSNHASQSYSDTITNCSGTHLLIEAFGTALDGNEALSFFGLTISDGAGIGVDDGASSSAFYGCYLGENLGSTVFINRVGTAVVDGGAFYFGSTPNTYAFSPVGGLIIARGVRFNGQVSATTALLVGNVGAGKVRFEGCTFGFITGGDPLMQDDPLGYGPLYPCFAPKVPRAYTGTGTNCTVTTADSGNLRTFAVTAVAAGTKTLSVTASLIGVAEWLVGPAYLVITYRSTVALNVRLAGGPAGTPPLKALATLPSTAGNLRTLVKLDGTLDSGAYTLIEIYTDAAVVGASIELTSVHLSDARMPLGNLWKC